MGQLCFSSESFTHNSIQTNIRYEYDDSYCCIYYQNGETIRGCCDSDVDDDCCYGVNFSNSNKNQILEKLKEMRRDFGDDQFNEEIGDTDDVGHSFRQTMKSMMQSMGVDNNDYGNGFGNQEQKEFPLEQNEEKSCDCEDSNEQDQKLNLNLKRKGDRSRGRRGERRNVSNGRGQGSRRGGNGSKGRRGERRNASNGRGHGSRRGGNVSNRIKMNKNGEKVELKRKPSDPKYNRTVETKRTPISMDQDGDGHDDAFGESVESNVTETFYDSMNDENFDDDQNYSRQSKSVRRVRSRKSRKMNLLGSSRE
jgi:hypothetical protein